MLLDRVDGRPGELALVTDDVDPVSRGEVTADLVERTVDICAKTLEEAEIAKGAHVSVTKLVLRDGNNEPVIDVDWDEMLLDTSTPEKRAALAVIVGGWIAGCEQAGYQAVEIDNLDSYSRSLGLLDQDQAVAFMALLSAEAHARGLAIAQKNSTELLPRRAEMGTDFAVSEECSHYDECGDYVATYGDAVLMIEYSDADFAKGCAAYPQMSIVRRDVEIGRAHV